jgi:hypothetical protein
MRHGADIVQSYSIFGVFLNMKVVVLFLQYQWARMNEYL